MAQFFAYSQPSATVTHDNGVWRIVALPIDDEAARRAGAAAIAAGQRGV